MFPSATENTLTALAARVCWLACFGAGSSSFGKAAQLPTPPTCVHNTMLAFTVLENHEQSGDVRAQHSPEKPALMLVRCTIHMTT
eukprot:854689-Pelagomonas_calceolata.AAC.6